MAQVGQGGNIRLSVQYQDGTGNRVDPTDPTLDIIDVNGSTVATGLIPTREAVGAYFYEYTVPADAGTGVWTARFWGNINGVTIYGDDPFEVVAAGSISPLTGLTLLDLATLKTALGKRTNEDDDALTLALMGATAAIQNYTGRQFVPNEVPGTRNFQYDGGGTVYIDDATSVTDVIFDGRRLDPSQWAAGPYNEPVKWWIDLPSFYERRTDPMGFTYNGDRIERLTPRSVTVEVLGDWGWPAVPADVQQAAIWTAAALFENPQPYISESIEGYSRTVGPAPTLAVPARAKTILEPYVKFHI